MAKTIDRFECDFDIETAVLEGKSSDVKAYKDAYFLQFMDLYQTRKIDELKSEVIYQDRLLDWLVQKYETEKDIGYSIGFLYGVMSVMKEYISKFYINEHMNRTIEKLDAIRLPHFNDILYAIEKEEGIQHGKLADAIGVDKSTLTGIMEKVISSGAVTFTRPGKFKYYYLSPAGKNYCADKRKQYETVYNIDALIEQLTSLVNREKNPSEVVSKIVKELYERKQMPSEQDHKTKRSHKVLDVLETVSEVGSFKMAIAGQRENYTVNSAVALLDNQDETNDILFLSAIKNEETKVKALITNRKEA